MTKNSTVFKRCFWYKPWSRRNEVGPVCSAIMLG